MKKAHSLRVIVAWIMICAFLLCETFFIGIFYSNMVTLLSGAERQHVDELTNAAKGALIAQLENMHANTRTWSSWDVVYDYILGQKADFVEEDLESGGMLRIYKMDYVVIKDRQGKDVLAMPSDIIMNDFVNENGNPPEDWAQVLPAGLSDRITPIACDVLAGQADGFTDNGPYCDVGYVVCNGESYMICVMPVLHTDETGEAVGTFTFAVHFGNERMGAITQMSATTFTVLEADMETIAKGDTIQIQGIENIVFTTVMENLYSARSVLLRLSHQRLVYNGGMALFATMIFTVSLVLVAFFGILFVVVDRNLLRSIRTLVTDVEHVQGSERFDVGKYQGFKETRTLSVAINDMATRVEESARVEHEASTSISILKSILNGMDAYVYVSDPFTNEILFINDKMQNHFDIEGEGVGQICWQVLQTGLAGACEFCPCRQLHSLEDVVVWEEHNTVTGRHYRNTDRLILWADGRLVHLQHSVDITDIKDTQAQLIAAKEQAEQGSRAKGEFLSRMSHEMRTPMNAIIGMTNIARGAKDIEKKEYCLERIDNASRHLLGVINDILDMSKIEANKFELSPTDFSLDTMLMNVLNVVNFRLEEKKQVLHMFVDPNIAPMLFGDEQRLAQVVTNLLTNAVKFTPEKGQISLNVTKEQDNANEQILRFEVQDTGIGISPAQQRRLFNPFEQADGSTSRQFGGTGLGLAISKRIVELMGGIIWVESELHKGSKFVFKAKVKPVLGSRLEKVRRNISKRDLNVLVVDDSKETCDYFMCLMENLGIRTQCAYSGLEAIERVNKEQSHFDMIFLDWQMPQMDGIQLAKQIRNADGTQPIIIMISVAEWADIEKEATGAGVDAFVPKPLFPSQITDCIHRFINLTEANKPIEAESQPQQFSFPGKTILLAEDIDINREIVQAILEDSHIDIISAENGLEAVEKFTKDPERYDLILMDVHMPQMDGLEATQHIRALNIEKAKSVPIVAMTANVFKEDVEQCLEVGMNGHLGKPIDFKELQAVVMRYLG